MLAILENSFDNFGCHGLRRFYIAPWWWHKIIQNFTEFNLVRWAEHFWWFVGCGFWLMASASGTHAWPRILLQYFYLNSVFVGNSWLNLNNLCIILVYKNTFTLIDIFNLFWTIIREMGCKHMEIAQMNTGAFWKFDKNYLGTIFHNVSFSRFLWNRKKKSYFGDFTPRNAVYIR